MINCIIFTIPTSPCGDSSEGGELYFIPIVLADLSAARNDSRAISFMRPENVRIFIESAKFLVNMFAIYSTWAGEIIKISLDISRVSSCFVVVFISFPALFCFLFLFIS